MDRPAFTVGIEEEYFLVDLESRDLAQDPPDELMKICGERLGDQVTPEFLRSQIEVGTRPHKTVAAAITELAEMRATIAEVAGKFDLGLIAASSHPFADYHAQSHTDKERYDTLARDIGAPLRRLQICGCHVHAGIGDDDLRIDLMGQIAYFLPHLLALTTSSPFWRGEDTGLMSYRLSVFDALPRTGLPDEFDSYTQYQRLVDQMVRSGGIEDATKIWWDVRPSARYPTLEMRIADVCTRLADCAALAATYQCLLSMLWRLRANNQRWRLYPRTLIQENRWRAMRYGPSGELMDFGKGEPVAYRELAAELADLLAEDADELGCTAEMQHIMTIAAEGTSADRQRAIYNTALETGEDSHTALIAVVDHLMVETLETS